MDSVKTLFYNTYVTFNPDNISEYYINESENVKPEVQGSKYMSKRVYGYIRNRLHHVLEREYIFDDTRVSLCVYTINKNNNLNQLYNILNFYIQALNKIQHKASVKIVLYMTNFKKLFPADTGKELNEDNVNSGMTLFNAGERMIVIYRKEELFKVLLHELIHLYGLDFYHYSPEVDKYMMEKHKIHVQEPHKNKANPLALYESYTETLACYGHLIANILFTQQISNGEELDVAIQKAATKEASHYMLQASKIMKFTHMKEDSHCFSYYFVKAALFRNIATFVTFVNSVGFMLDTIEKQQRFLSFVKSVTDDPTFWKDLKKLRTKRIVMSSLKMSKVRW